jgi:hypothetical protein
MRSQSLGIRRRLHTREVTTEELEWRAVELIQPSLGGLIQPLRKLEPQNDREYPGYTFDFVARRADGAVLAIEVTGAWNQEWLRAHNTLGLLARRLTPELAVAGCAPGHYVLQAIGPRQVPMHVGKIRLDELARTASTLAPHSGIETEWGFELRNWGGSIERPVAHGSVTTAEFVDGGEAGARFQRAVDDCAPKLHAAGRAGMRTYLVVVHWMLGSSKAWRSALDELTLEEHPQEIWAVDLGGWEHGEPTERLR